MSDPIPGRFLNFLKQQIPSGDLVNEMLRHEMSATINRNRLTRQEEGIHSFNTEQLNLVVCSNPSWSRDHIIFQAMLISNLIDGRLATFREAQACELIPDSWTWVTWADGFAGSESELCVQLNTIQDPRHRGGAVCLASATRSDCIGIYLLAAFCHPSMAIVYHRLLAQVLAAPASAATAAIAAHELERLGNQLEVLFTADTDVTIATLVQASDLDHPEHLIFRVQEATGDFTRTAIARRHLERGRASEALAQIKDLRFLSPAYEQAILVAALAALEMGKIEEARGYAKDIVPDDLRLKVQTRIAQASGDIEAEAEALIDLYERNPADVQVFVQLVNVLDRLQRFDLSRDLCYRAQESFSGDPVVEAIIKRHLAIMV